MRTVCFSHGRESGPEGHKISVLSRIANDLGWSAVSVDYRETLDPDRRVDILLERFARPSGRLVLVGSSMGAYVAAVSSRNLAPDGLFLLAPAFGLDGYRRVDPEPCAGSICIVHGWRDEVVPVDNVISYARRHQTDLHLLDSGHTLVEALPKIEGLFRSFLQEIASSQGPPA